MRPSRPAAVLAAAALLLTAGQAFAHARMTASTPAANAVVAAPKTITLTFNERVAPAFSSFDLVAPGGRTVKPATAVSKDGKSITGKLAAPLAKGGYTVNWRAVSADGHRMTGTFAFKVN
ncbi:copper homeostasis periplasmic binding protein CopC [Caulobacter mirabilis]|uniref:Copper resistance protein CopC n=1 Tax=Caulobacter mirabilis TaxID=69666 RepID=A0A2D2B0R6_9CAUL|nr:copper homeostasis periplasmic binding protein CopC [Caulobacter mirabilis]ATQ43851.1 copper resistance protein CopC [Caulobacter mirabilis]